MMALVAGLVCYSIIKTLGPVIGKTLLNSITTIDKQIGSELGELIVLTAVLQVSLLLIVIIKKWGGFKATAAGIMAGLLLSPTIVLSEVNKTVEKITQSYEYSVIKKDEKIAELRVEDTTIVIPTTLVDAIMQQYPLPKSEINMTQE
jgi:hypothetical protein